MNSLFSEGCKDRAGDYLQREFSRKFYSLVYLTGR